MVNFKTMNMDLRQCILVVFGFILYNGSFANGDHDRDICEADHSYGGYTYCDAGYYCCDDNTRCCAEGVSVAAVVGIVMACLVMIGLCLFCSILIAKKKKLRPGQMVAPSNNRGATLNQQHIYIGSYSNAREGRLNFLSPHYATYGQAPPPYGQPFQQGQPLPYSQVVPSAFPSSSEPPQPPPYCQNDQAAPPAYKLEP